LSASPPPHHEEISRRRYDRIIVHPVRSYIERNHLKDEIRCLATFLGLPIKIGKITVLFPRKKKMDQWDKLFIRTLDEFERNIEKLESISRGKAPTTQPRMPTQQDYPRLVGRHTSARAAAYGHIQKNKDDLERAKEELNRLVNLVQAAEGLAAIVTQVQPHPVDPDGVDQFRHVQKLLKIQQLEAREILDRGIDDPERERPDSSLPRPTASSAYSLASRTI